MTANSWSQRLFGCFRAQPSADLLPCIAKHHHDLRSDQNAESRTHNQYDTDSDVMQIAWAFVPIAPSGPSSHDPCRCHHIQKNGAGIDDQTSPEGHAARTKACAPPPNILYRSKSGDVRQAVPRIANIVERQEATR